MCDDHEKPEGTDTAHSLESENNDNDIIQAYGENGIIVTPFQTTEDEILAEGYTKAPDDVASLIQQILQQLPSVIKDRAIEKDAQRAFSEATKGTFKCILDPSLQLGNSKSLEGAFSGLAFDKEGHLKAQANWIPNDAKMNISEVPQVTASIFNALSIVTAQYYLSRINDQLNTVNKKLDSIEQEIDIRKIAELQALMQGLQDIETHRKYIDKETDRINVTRFRIEELIGKAELLVNQYRNELHSFHLQKEDDEQTVKSTIQKMETAIYRYYVSSVALAHAKVLAAYYNVRVPEELKQYQFEINSIIKNFEDDKNNALNRMHRYVSTSGAYEVRDYSAIFSYGLLKIPVKIIHDYREYVAHTRRQDMLTSIEKYRKSIENDSIYKLSKTFKEVQESKIEVASINDDIYIHKIEG